MSTGFARACYGVALFFGVLPLWAGQQLPLVDLPQHLHLISVLHRLHDPTTLYPQLFALRAQLTPYLGYYYLVSALSWLLPLPIANKVFLSLYVAGIPLGLAFLLRSCDRPVWPSLLALPFAYGDSFAWGFINYCCAIPLAFGCLGCFIRAIADSTARGRWAVACSVLLVAVLLFHVQVFVFLGLALPILLLTTRAPEDPVRQKRGRSAHSGTPVRPERIRGAFSARWPALLSLLPGVALFLVWGVARVGQPTEVAYGVPWKAWGPLLSPQNLSFKSFSQNREEFTQVLANMLRDGTDRYPLYAVAVVAAAALLCALLPFARPETAKEGPIARLRILLLGLVALGMYFTLPFDIRGYIYYLNTRFAHLAAALLICALPVLRAKIQKPFLVGGTACAVLLGFTLAKAFAAFNVEASFLADVVAASGSKPMVMGLIFDPFSRVVRHPVFLHSAAFVAQEKGGAPNFSFALTPHSPLRYRTEPPPTFPSEWHPEEFRYERYGNSYDHFLLRGISAARVFGPLLESELKVAARSGTFTLVRRR